eukprot:4906823-Karenia_brevis.AAC.1
MNSEWASILRVQERDRLSGIAGNELRVGFSMGNKRGGRSGKEDTGRRSRRWEGGGRDAFKTRTHTS